jgi:hypothetical protein
LPCQNGSPAASVQVPPLADYLIIHDDVGDSRSAQYQVDPCWTTYLANYYPQMPVALHMNNNPPHHEKDEGCQFMGALGANRPLDTTGRIQAVRSLAMQQNPANQPVSPPMKPVAFSLMYPVFFPGCELQDVNGGGTSPALVMYDSAHDNGILSVFRSLMDTYNAPDK